jgi:hypothetical protein
MDNQPLKKRYSLLTVICGGKSSVADKSNKFLLRNKEFLFSEFRGR